MPVEYNAAELVEGMEWLESRLSLETLAKVRPDWLAEIAGQVTFSLQQIRSAEALLADRLEATRRLAAGGEVVE